MNWLQGILPLLAAVNVASLSLPSAELLQMDLQSLMRHVASLEKAQPQQDGIPLSEEDKKLKKLSVPSWEMDADSVENCEAAASFVCPEDGLPGDGCKNSFPALPGDAEVSKTFELAKWVPRGCGLVKISNTLSYPVGAKIEIIQQKSDKIITLGGGPAPGGRAYRVATDKGTEGETLEPKCWDSLAHFMYWAANFVGEGKEDYTDWDDIKQKIVDYTFEQGEEGAPTKEQITAVFEAGKDAAVTEKCDTIEFGNSEEGKGTSWDAVKEKIEAAMIAAEGGEYVKEMTSKGNFFRPVFIANYAHARTRWAAAQMKKQGMTAVLTFLEISQWPMLYGRFKKPQEFNASITVDDILEYHSNPGSGEWATDCKPPGAATNMHTGECKDSEKVIEGFEDGSVDQLTLTIPPDGFVYDEKFNAYNVQRHAIEAALGEGNHLIGSVTDAHEEDGDGSGCPSILWDELIHKHVPATDYSSGAGVATDASVTNLVDWLKNGNGLFMHCFGGMGRTFMGLLLLTIQLTGAPWYPLMHDVRTFRGHIIESEAQSFILALASAAATVKVGKDKADWTEGMFANTHEHFAEPANFLMIGSKTEEGELITQAKRAAELKPIEGRNWKIVKGSCTTPWCEAHPEIPEECGLDDMPIAGATLQEATEVVKKIVG